MNMYMQGVDPELDLSDMPHLAEVFERLTQMKIDDRHPWCGKLVFAAFSGSHQDAISKGMHYRIEMILTSGLFHIFLLILKMLAVHMIQMLSELTASQVRVA